MKLCFEDMILVHFIEACFQNTILVYLIEIMLWKHEFNIKLLKSCLKDKTLV